MNKKVKEIKELQDHANKLGEIITQQTNKRIQLEDRIKKLEKECEFRKVAVDRWVPCPDHRDKTDGQCYVCKLEKAEARIKQLEEGIEKHKNTEGKMKKFTIFYDQINRTNYQVLAKDEAEATLKADKLYKKEIIIPCCYVQTGWISESDGENK